MANQPANGLVPVYVSGADTVSARMPYPGEQETTGARGAPILVITRQGGAQELYDSSTHAVICK